MGYETSNKIIIRGKTLEGKSFCFTGALNTMKRKEAEEMVEGAGGTVKSGITKDLTYLVTNDKESGSVKNKRPRNWESP